MKKIYIILGLVTIFGLFSCKKFLETVPTDFVSPQNYYETEEQLNFAMNGVYDPLGWSEMYSYYIWGRLTIATDEAYCNKNLSKTAQTNMVINRSDAFDPDVRLFWRALYQGIDRANRLLENVNKPKMDEAKRAQIEGEAKFLRGYYYFLLVSYFGDVPLLLSSTTSLANTDVPRTPSKQVYDQILVDMKDAETKVASIQVLGYGGRVSKSAVQGILARVCLTMAGYPLKDESKYAEAATWARKVVEGGYHQLSPDYSQVFVNYAQDKYDPKESIWEVEFYGNLISDQYRETGRLGNLNGILYTVNNSTIGYTYGYYSATAYQYDLYNANDLRRDWSIAPYTLNTTTGARVAQASTAIYNRYCGKWRREYEVLTRSNSGTPQNFPLLRYSDVLLMLAEAENERSGPDNAYQYVNEVRKRGYGILYGNRVKTITVTNPGSGYTTAPTVNIPGATAVISGGKITAVTLSPEPGTFTLTAPYYSSAPAIIFTGGGGSGAAATATITTSTEADLLPQEMDSRENLRKSIREERVRELSFEALRRADLIRWGIYIPTMKASANAVLATYPSTYQYAADPGLNTTDKYVLFPIPQTEIGVNKLLTQNPGW